MDKIYCPLNIDQNHWVMVVVFMQKREVHYIDSMSGPGGDCMNHVLRWLRDQAEERKMEKLDTAEWKKFSSGEYSGEHLQVPQQRNGFDCGILSCLAADYLSDHLPLTYSQGDMPHFRAKIAAAILKGELSY
jgi:sentrin-specific protease 1